MIRLGVKKRKASDETAVGLIRQHIGRRSIVLVGLMGCGKSSIGRRLAAVLEMPFVDADDEIETAAGMSIPEIFSVRGEADFRDGERRVIRRLLGQGPQVLATGGGAYMNPETREAIRSAGICIWLKAELPVLMRRVMKRDDRPLLKAPDPEGVMRRLMETRYPVYAEADLVVESRDVPHEVIVSEILATVAGSPLLLDPGPRGATAESMNG